jgi:DNA-binding NarL/FixJ family response regulator
VDASVGIREPLPLFRDGLRAEFTRASWVVHEPRDIVAWALAEEPRHLVFADEGAAGRRKRAVVLSLTMHGDWSVLDELHDRCPDVAVVALLPQPRSEDYRDAIARGARSAAPRSATGGYIAAVVRAAIDGRALLPASVLTLLASQEGAGREAGLVNDEEKRWLMALATGTSVDTLAWRSGYSRRTMYRRLNRVYRRLGADRRESALVAAARAGLI